MISGLLPRVVSDELHRSSLFAASTTFGVVALVLVLALLVEGEVFGHLDTTAKRRGIGMAIVVPLLVTVLATLVARVARVVH